MVAVQVEQDEVQLLLAVLRQVIIVQLCARLNDGLFGDVQQTLGCLLPCLVILIERAERVHLELLQDGLPECQVIEAAADDRSDTVAHFVLSLLVQPV